MFNALEAAPVETPWIWNPDDRKQRARVIHNAMLVFNTDMAKAKDAGRIPKGQEGQLDAWRLFRDEWAKWYGSAGAFTWLSSSTDTTMDGYEKSLAGWRDWFNGSVGTPSGQGTNQYKNTGIIPSDITVHTPEVPEVPTAGNIGWYVGLGLAGALGIYAFLSRKRGTTFGSLTVRPVPLDREGCDDRGKCWGAGNDPLFEVYDDVLNEREFVRAQTALSARLRAMKKNKAFDRPENTFFFGDLRTKKRR